MGKVIFNLEFITFYLPQKYGGFFMFWGKSPNKIIFFYGRIKLWKEWYIYVCAHNN